MEKLSPEELFMALLEYNYIIYLDGQLIITDNFYQEFKDPSKFTVKRMIKEAAIKDVGVTPLPLIEVEVEEPILSKFVIDAKVPAYFETSTGKYAVNKFNMKANRELVKLLKVKKLNYLFLVLSATIYYKSGVRPKTISNFILEEIWREEYSALAKESQKGEAAFNAYVKSKTQNETTSKEGRSRFKR